MKQPSNLTLGLDPNLCYNRNRNGQYISTIYQLSPERRIDMEELKEELPSIEDLVLARLRNLSVERRKEVLDFV